MKHINTQKLKRIFLICITLVTLLSVFSRCYADSIFPSGMDPTSIISDPTDDPVANDIISKILGIVQFFGGAAAVGILMVLGIRYMMGSIEEKANYKESMPPYLIGAILLGGAPTLVRVIYSTVVAIGR